MLRWSVPPLALATCLTGCVLSPIDLEGRACDELDRCAEGYSCDLATRTCVRGEATDAGLDAHETIDAATIDAPGLDAVVVDATSADVAIAMDAAGEDATADAGSDARSQDAPMSDAGRVADPVRFDATGRLDLTGPEFTGIDVVPIEAEVRDGQCVIVMPARTAARPLTVTNHGGQVRCARMRISGGPFWRLTGRFEGPLGDGGYPGHAAGYAGSRGRYGFHVTQNLVVGPSAAVENAEIEFVEVAPEGAPSSAAALVIGDPSTVAATYRDVAIHDCYVHDTPASDPIGGTRNAATVEGLDFYRNRVVRAGGACFERLVLGDRTSIHDNLFVGCRLGEPITGSVEPAIELRARSGAIRFERNLVIGSRGSALRVEDVGDEPPTTTTASFVATTSEFFVVRGDWARYDAELGADGSSLALADLYFGSAPGSGSPLAVVRVVRGIPILDLARVHWDPGLSPPAVNGTTSSMSFDMVDAAASARSVDASHFTLTADPSTLALWSATDTYPAMAHVLDGGVIYQAPSGAPAGAVPSAGGPWSRVGVPDDDVLGLPLSAEFLSPP